MTRTENVPVVVAMREALVNVLIHRDYFDNTQARLRIFNDRIETYNAGAAPKTVEEIISNEATAPRNPLIAKLFRMVGLAETAGSGMLKIFSAWKQLNYKTPVIDNNVANYYFKMTFPLEKKSSRIKPELSSEKSSEKIIKILSDNPAASIREIAEKINITTRAVEKQMAVLKTKGRIVRIGPDRGGHWEVVETSER